MTIKLISEPFFSDSIDAENYVPFSLLNAPKKRAFKRKYRTQQLNTSYGRDEDDKDGKKRRKTILLSDQNCEEYSPLILTASVDKLEELHI